MMTAAEVEDDDDGSEVAAVQMLEGLGILLKVVSASEEQLEAASKWCDDMCIERVEDTWEVADEDEWEKFCEALQLEEKAANKLCTHLRGLKEGKFKLGEEAPRPPQRPPLPPLQQRLDDIVENGIEADRPELDFSDEALGDEGVQRLVKGLEGNSGLRRLRLHRCYLTPKGFAHVGQLLYEGGRIAASQGSFGKADGQQKAGGGGYADKLELLVLSGNDCSPKGPGRDFCDGLSMIVHLKSLSLAMCNLGDAGVTDFFEVLSLRDGGAKAACLLEELDISHNNLGPATARALVSVLGRNEHLRSLSIKANELGPEGADAMAKCLVANKGRLQRLDIAQNGFMLDGARMLLEAFVSPVTFAINIVRPSGQSTGATLSATLRVMGINPTSVLDQWNNNRPAEAVRAGDFVVRVNDKTSTKLILEELGSRAELEIVVNRPGAGLSYMDICYNGITNPGVEELRDEVGRPQGCSLQGSLLRWPGGRQVSMNAS